MPYIALCGIALHDISLQCIVLHSQALYCLTLYCILLHGMAQFRSYILTTSNLRVSEKLRQISRFRVSLYFEDIPLLTLRTPSPNKTSPESREQCPASARFAYQQKSTYGLTSSREALPRLRVLPTYAFRFMSRSSYNSGCTGKSCSSGGCNG